MPPSACAKCAKCGSNLALSPGSHRDPSPHTFDLIQQVETDDGPRQLTRCRYCHRTKAEVQKEEADTHFFLDGTRYDVIGPVIGATVRAKLGAERCGYHLHIDHGATVPLGETVADSDLVPTGTKLCAVPHATR
jgi:hypothetical protein